jgi:hypothetical protein
MPQLRRLIQLAILVVFLFLLGACGGAIGSEVVSPEEPPEELIDEPMPGNISFWDFQDGPPEGWDVSPGWKWVEGNAVSDGQEQIMFTDKQWANFNLITRMEIVFLSSRSHTRQDGMT